MKTNSPLKIIGVLALSATMAGTAIAGPAYPTMFIVKKEPPKHTRTAKVQVLKDKSKVATIANPRPNAAGGRISG